MFIQDGSADRSEAYRLLADLFARPPEDDDLEVIRRDLELKSGETAREVLDEFNHLLRYPGGMLPPLESLSAGSGDIDVAESVSESYERAGLTIGEEFEAPPDHLSLELLFISYLVETNNPGLIENFLDEHIMNWVPYYCEELKRQARTVFYKEIADITRNFLQNEYGSFG
ncbi:MAG: molecular chaperone TorD family protein [Candidatus Sulfobium sp.]|jgi:putative dimethyl sulfoxide reductase chaperone